MKKTSAALVSTQAIDPVSYVPARWAAGAAGAAGAAAAAGAASAGAAAAGGVASAAGAAAGAVAGAGSCAISGAGGRANANRLSIPSATYRIIVVQLRSKHRWGRQSQSQLHTQTPTRSRKEQQAHCCPEPISRQHSPSVGIAIDVPASRALHRGVSVTYALSIA